MDTKQTMTRLEVAAALKVSTKTVVRWEKAGLLPAIRIAGSVRYSADDVEALISRGKASA